MWYDKIQTYKLYKYRVLYKSKVQNKEVMSLFNNDYNKNQ